MDDKSPWLIIPALVVAAIFLIEMFGKLSSEPVEPDNLENDDENSK